MIEYFRLAPPKKSDRLMATTIADPDDFEVSVCPEGNFTLEVSMSPEGELIYDRENIGPHWDGERLRTELAVSVKHSKRDELLIWGWLSGVLVHEKLIAEFEALRLTGYRLRPGSVRFRDGRLSKEYRELVVVGWAGIAPEESGIHVTKRCPSCHLVEYSGLVHPEKLIDWSQWTGEDFFMVWPLSSGYILITGRVAGLLQDRKVKSYSLEKSNNTWGAMAGFTVTRLSSRMPDDLARKYGEPLGLESGTATWIPRSQALKSRRSAPPR